MKSRGELVEIRTPTYRRPEYLRAAIESLIGQTWTNWRCLVFDDSPDQESKAVCESFKDARVLHTFNSPRRYAARNVDMAFESVSADADYAFSLEDDNLVLPQFIEENIAELKRTGTNILLRNQLVAREGIVTSDTVLGSRFVDGVYSPLELYVSLFFSPGISNGGLFWSRKAESNLVVGYDDCGASIQEYLRSMSLIEDVTVSTTPLAVYTVNGSATTRNMGTNHTGRREARSRQLIRQTVYDALSRRGQLQLLGSPRIGSQKRLNRGVLLAQRRWPMTRLLSTNETIRAMVKARCIANTKLQTNLAEFLRAFAARN